MYKLFIALKKKIEVLKNNNLLIEQLNIIEEDIFLLKSRTQGKNEVELNALLSTGGFLNKLNILALECSKTIQTEYNKITIEVINTEPDNMCVKCNVKLMRTKDGNCCDLCGYIEIVPNIYYGERKYKPSKLKDTSTDHYCEEWLNYLQGKCLIVIPGNLLLNLLNECRNICVYKNTKKITEYNLELIQENVNLDLIDNIKCSHIRIWLSKYNNSSFNKYIPTIHRKLTRDLGREIIPPQFTATEEKIILNDWRMLSETYCTQYKILKQKSNKKKNNNPYYPVCIFFIVKKRFNDIRAIKLEDYIHKQSVETYRMRLQCWEKTCEILNYNPNIISSEIKLSYLQNL